MFYKWDNEPVLLEIKNKIKIFSVPTDSVMGILFIPDRSIDLLKAMIEGHWCGEFYRAEKKRTATKIPKVVKLVASFEWTETERKEDFLFKIECHLHHRGHPCLRTRRECFEF